MKKLTKQNKSGKNKARKQKKAAPKPVSGFVHFKATGNKNGNVNIQIGENGEVRCAEAEEGTLSHYRCYMRDSGKEKRIVRSYSKSGEAFPEQRENIINNYDVLAGIDTNDYVRGDKKLSVAVCYYAKSIRAKNVAFEPTPSFIIADIKFGINSEVIAWHLFIIHIFPLLNITKDMTLGLVVDSELGKHPAINRRDEPYYRDNYLPQNVGVIYASSDTGTDLPNKLIKSCDAGSRKLFRMIQKGEIVLPSELGGGSEDYSGYAYVNHAESPYKIGNMA